MKAVHAWPRKYEKNGLIGYADVSFALVDGAKGCFTIKDWSVFRNQDGGIRVAYPSKKNKEGEWHSTMNINIETPEGKDLLDSITERVAMAFSNINKEQSPQKQPTNDTQNSNPKAMDNEGLDIPF